MISFLRGNLRWIAAGFLLTFASSFGQTFFISLSNETLRERFDLTHGGLGFVYGAATLASAFILLEFGKIVDRVSVRTAAMIVVTGAAIATFLLASASALWMLFLALLGLRLFCQGMMSHVAMTATGRWFEAQRGRAVSVVSLGYPSGEALFPLIAVLVIGSVGFDALWRGGSVMLLLVVLPVLYCLLSKERAPSTPTQHASEGQKHRDWRRKELLAAPHFYLLLTCVLCPGFMVTCFFFHQLHLMDLKNWSLNVFASAFTAFAVAQVGASLVAGALIDRFGAVRLLPVYLLPLALGLVLVAPLGGIWAIYLIMVLIGLTAGSGATLMGAIWPELYGVRYLGEIRALTFAFMVAATAASPFLTGYLIDAEISFLVQLVWMGVYCVLASVMMLLAQPRLMAIRNS